MGCGDAVGFADPGFGLVTGSGPFADDGKKKPANRHLKKYGEAIDFILGKTEEIAPRVYDLTAANADRYRNLELESFKEYGPKYVEAIGSADPMQHALRSRMNEIVLGNLDEGLDPAMAREVAQGSRGAYAARGLEYSPASAVGELLSMGRAGKDLEMANLGAGSDLLAANQRVIGDPFMAVTGRGANVSAPNSDPFQNEGSSDVYNAYWQNRWQQQSRKDAKRAEIMQLAGSVISGASGAAGAFV